MQPEGPCCLSWHCVGQTTAWLYSSLLGMPLKYPHLLLHPHSLVESAQESSSHQRTYCSDQSKLRGLATTLDSACVQCPFDTCMGSVIVSECQSMWSNSSGAFQFCIHTMKMAQELMFCFQLFFGVLGSVSHKLDWSLQYSHLLGKCWLLLRVMLYVGRYRIGDPVSAL